MLRAAVQAARPYPGLSILALTVVTSMRDSDLAEIGVSATVSEQVIRLATLVATTGCDGVVTLPLEEERRGMRH